MMHHHLLREVDVPVEEGKAEEIKQGQFSVVTKIPLGTIIPLQTNVLVIAPIMMTGVVGNVCSFACYLKQSNFYLACIVHCVLW